MDTIASGFNDQHGHIFLESISGEFGIIGIYIYLPGSHSIVLTSLLIRVLKYTLLLSSFQDHELRTNKKRYVLFSQTSISYLPERSARAL